MKTVLITGASRGIGAACARLFAQKGWAVGINYCRSEKAAKALEEEIRRGGGRGAALPGDVSDPAQAQALVAAAQAELGPLDALVCCAGVAQQ